MDAICDWAANNPTAAWGVFIAIWVLVVATVACWPTKLPDLNNPNDFGC